MRYTNKCIRVFWLSCFIAVGLEVWAQPLTIDGAIEAAKKKKSQQTTANTESLPVALLPPSSTSGQSLTLLSSPPKIWSIKGINGDYTAEIIYQQKIHSVKLVTGTFFLLWEIIDFDNDSVTLREVNSKPKKPSPMAQQESATKKPLKLFVAPTGNTIATYLIPNDSGELNTLQRQAAANLPASPPPPAPPSPAPSTKN